MDRLRELGLTARRPVLDDARRVFDLIAAVDQHDLGSVDMSEDDVRDELAHTELQSDAWLVVPNDARGGAPGVALAALRLRGGVLHQGNIVVHPEWRRRGIGGTLAGWLEERARQKAALTPDGAQVSLLGWVKGDSPDLAWARQRGFDWARRFLRMRIDMTEPPPAPSWPAEIEVRTYEPGQDEQVTHAALEEAFADHWGHVETPFDEWVTRTTRRDFDPSLWYLAWDGDRVVATATNSVMPDNLGWISGLGVVPSHRRRGLARAILFHSFGEFWRRGRRSVALGVDADSLTGATRLYESVGMRVEQQFDQVRKVLREGIPQEAAV